MHVVPTEQRVTMHGFSRHPLCGLGVACTATWLALSATMVMAVRVVKTRENMALGSDNMCSLRFWEIACGRYKVSFISFG
jgi:hypothetical protein